MYLMICMFLYISCVYSEQFFHRQFLRFGRSTGCQDIYNDCPSIRDNLFGGIAWNMCHTEEYATSCCQFCFAEMSIVNSEKRSYDSDLGGRSFSCNDKYVGCQLIRDNLYGGDTSDMCFTHEYASDCCRFCYDEMIHENSERRRYGYGMEAYGDGEEGRSQLRRRRRQFLQ